MYFRFFPNFLSFSRIFIVPFIIILIIKNTFFTKILSLVLFFIGSVTDFLDGYIARKYNLKSNLGTYIDPLADKILVIVTLCLLSFFYPDQIPIWMIAVIFSRDMFIMIYRRFLISKNRILNTSRYAKLKTLFQIISIHIILIFHITNPDYIYQYNYSYSLILFSMIFSFITAFHYIYINSFTYRK